MRFFILLLISGSLLQAESIDPNPYIAWVKTLGDGRLKHGGYITEIIPLGNDEVLTAATDSTARIWNLKTGEEVRRFLHAEDVEDVWSARLLSDKRRFITGSEGGVNRLWNLETGELLKEYDQENTTFRTALTPDETQFVATDSDDSIVLWDLEKGTNVRTFADHTKSVYCAVILSDGKTLYTGGDSDKMRKWNLETGELIKAYKKVKNDLYTMVPEPGHDRFLICCEKGLRYWDGAKGKQIWYAELENGCKYAAWSPDGQTIAVTEGSGKKLHMLNQKDGSEVWQIDVPYNDYSPVAFTPDGSEIITSGFNALFRWNPEDGAAINGADESIPLGNSSAVCASADGTQVFVASSDTNRVYQWDCQEEIVDRTWEISEGPDFLDTSPDGKSIAIGYNGKIKLIELATDETKTLDHGGSLYGAQFVSDTHLASTGSDDRLVIWNAKSGKLANEIPFDNDLNALGVSADGRRVLVGGDDNVVSMVNVASGKKVGKFEALESEIRSVCFDGKAVLSRNKGVLLFWNPPRETTALGTEEISALVKQLGADKYKEREAATLKLKGGGNKVLETIEKVTSSDPEVKARIKEILGVIGGVEANAVFEAAKKLKYTGDDSKLYGDPLGRYWVTIDKSDMHSELVVGGFDDGKPVEWQRIKNGRGPVECDFSADGKRLFVANLDSTVSVYELKR